VSPPLAFMCGDAVWSVRKSHLCGGRIVSSPLRRRGLLSAERPRAVPVGVPAPRSVRQPLRPGGPAAVPTRPRGIRKEGRVPWEQKSPPLPLKKYPPI